MFANALSTNHVIIHTYIFEERQCDSLLDMDAIVAPTQVILPDKVTYVSNACCYESP